MNRPGLTPRTVATLMPDVVVQAIGDEALMLKLDREIVYSLNATGARIVALLDGKRTAGDIIATLADEYDVARVDITSEVLRLLDALAARAIVTTRSSG